MAQRKSYGKTASGEPISDELVEQLADKAEAGYDVDERSAAGAGAHRSAPPPPVSNRSDSTRSCAKRSTSEPSGTTRPPLR
jgi:hypothetical protein